MIPDMATLVGWLIHLLSPLRRATGVAPPTPLLIEKIDEILRDLGLQVESRRRVKTPIESSKEEMSSWSELESRDLAETGDEGKAGEYFVSTVKRQRAEQKTPGKGTATEEDKRVSEDAMSTVDKGSYQTPFRPRLPTDGMPIEEQEGPYDYVFEEDSNIEVMEIPITTEEMRGFPHPPPEHLSSIRLVVQEPTEPPPPLPLAWLQPDMTPERVRVVYRYV